MKLSIPIAILIAGFFIGGVLYFTSKNEPTQIPIKNTTTSFENNKIENKNNLLQTYKTVKSNLPAHGYVCIPETKSECGPDGCIPLKPGVFVLFGEDKNEEVFIARCDNKPCDVYPANLTNSGAFISIDTKEPHGLVFKASTKDLSFVEVVTLGTYSLVSNGYCYDSKSI